MKKKITNKLVRDKIPNILMEQGKAFKAHPLHGSDFSKQLANKLIEEAIELKAAIENGIHLSNIEPLSFEDCENLDKGVLEEFADVFEVFIKLMKVENFLLQESFCVQDIPRHDPVLVKIVEELKDEANGECAKLVVAEINTPMYRIEDYDGMESIQTPEAIDWIVIEEK